MFQRSKTLQTLRIFWQVLFAKHIRRNKQYSTQEYEIAWGKQQQGKQQMLLKYGQLGLYRNLDYINDSLNELANIVREIKPARILEIGCGNGQVIIPLAAQFPHIQFYGIDLTSLGIEESRRNSTAAGLSIDFRRGDFTQLPFRDEFDLVYSRLAIEQCPRDYLQAFREVHRVTKKYAIFIEEFHEFQNLLQSLYLWKNDYFYGSFYEVEKVGFRILKCYALPLQKISYKPVLLLCEKK